MTLPDLQWHNSCWAFWSYALPLRVLADLARVNPSSSLPANGASTLAGALLVRATDEGTNLQPRDMYLNPTSMLNNWWFRVAVRRVEDSVDDKGAITLEFEHPAVVGQTREGWMDVSLSFTLTIPPSVPFPSSRTRH